MPHFRIETNVPSKNIPSDFAKKLCELIATTLGKPLNFTVVTVVGDAQISWGGVDEPSAQATLMSIGSLDVEKNKQYSKVFYEFISKQLNISTKRMYIHYINAASSDVGYDYTTFHEILG